MPEKDAIKEAFVRAKQDIHSLKDQFSLILNEIQDIKRTLYDLMVSKQTRQTNKPQDLDALAREPNTSTEVPTDNWSYKPLKPHIYSISTGNGGVPTDRQTDQQTDRPTSNFNRIDQIERVSEILESLDTIKKDLRSKFKRLTRQEMLVFSTIYQLQEEGFVVDYPKVAQKLALSESSIRDYIQKIVKKGIPIQKNKENNKKILLFIPKELTQIASLQAIIQLREL